MAGFACITQPVIEPGETIPALLPFGTILLTPLFGNLYDRKGNGANIMILGSVLLIIVHALFSVPFLNQTPVAIFLIIVLGIGFSLVPSAMWPSVPKIIPENQLGTAYALIFYIQKSIMEPIICKSFSCSAFALSNLILMMRKY